MFKTSFIFLLTIFCLAIVIDATNFNHCQNVRSDRMSMITSVEISGCQNAPCNLRRGTRTSLHETFIPNKNIRQLKTSVKAIILGLPFPFVGVDNVDASNHIFTANGEKADWPLIAGNEYHYKNSFSVEKFYPRVAPAVHWALLEDNETVTCFVVNAKIV